MTVLEEILNTIDELKELREEIRASVSQTYGVDTSDMSMNEVMTYTKEKITYYNDVDNDVVNEDDRAGVDEYRGYISSSNRYPITTKIFPRCDMDLELIGANFTAGGNDYVTSRRNQFRLFAYQNAFYLDCEGRLIQDAGDLLAQHTIKTSFGYAIAQGAEERLPMFLGRDDEPAQQIFLGPTYNIYQRLNNEVFTAPLIIYGRTDREDINKDEIKDCPQEIMNMYLDPQYGQDPFDFIALKIYKRINGTRTLTNHIVVEKDVNGEACLYDRVTGDYYYAYGGSLNESVVWYDPADYPEEDPTPGPGGDSPAVVEPNGYVTVMAGTYAPIPYTAKWSTGIEADVEDVDFSNGAYLFKCQGTDQKSTYINNSGNLVGNCGGGQTVSQTSLSAGRHILHDMCYGNTEQEPGSMFYGTTLNDFNVAHTVWIDDDEKTGRNIGPVGGVYGILNGQWGGSTTLFAQNIDGSGTTCPMKLHRLTITELDEATLERKVVHNYIGGYDGAAVVLIDTVTNEKIYPQNGSFVFTPYE